MTIIINITIIKPWPVCPCYDYKKGHFPPQHCTWSIFNCLRHLLWCCDITLGHLRSTDNWKKMIPVCLNEQNKPWILLSPNIIPHLWDQVLKWSVLCQQIFQDGLTHVEATWHVEKPWRQRQPVFTAITTMMLMCSHCINSKKTTFLSEFWFNRYSSRSK